MNDITDGTPDQIIETKENTQSEANIHILSPISKVSEAVQGAMQSKEQVSETLILPLNLDGKSINNGALEALHTSKIRPLKAPDAENHVKENFKNLSNEFLVKVFKAESYTELLDEIYYMKEALNLKELYFHIDIDQSRYDELIQNPLTKNLITETALFVATAAHKRINIGINDREKFSDMYYKTSNITKSNIVIEGDKIGTMCYLHSALDNDNTQIKSYIQDAISKILDGILLKFQRLAKLNKLDALISTDVMTGLFNRRYVDEKMGNLFMNNETLSLFMIDGNQFKEKNDTYGHDIGDDIIRWTGSIITKSVNELNESLNRESSSKNACFAARIGGDEFQIVLPGIDIDKASVHAQKLLDTMRETPYSYKKNKDEKVEINVTVSIGISTKNENISNSHELYISADRALRIAKEGDKSKGGYICAK